MRNFHSVTDKAMFDVINQKKISINSVRELFIDRGILVSSVAERKELALYYSKIYHDYVEYEKISTLTETKSHAEKNIFVKLNNDVNKDILRKAAEQLKKTIEDHNDLCVIKMRGNGLVLDVTYVVTDFDKSEFNQNKKKNAIIEIMENDGGYKIRRPNNQYAEEYQSELLRHIVNEERKVKKDDEIKLDIEEIQIVSNDHKVRTSFFDSLINDMEGYKFIDVTDIYVYHLKSSEIEEEDGDVETGVHVSKASLAGEGVMKSRELKNLFERGFYIWKAQWIVEEKNANPNRLELEAQFSEPIEFKDFAYLAKGVWRYKANGSHQKTKKKLLPKECSDINNLIEETARSIFNKLTKKQED